MFRQVIDAGNLKRQPAFQLSQGESRALFRRVISLFVYAGERGARQYMDGSHHRADQAFDVTAKVGSCSRTMIQLNAILLTTPYQCLGMKFLGVVNVNHPW